MKNQKASLFIIVGLVLIFSCACEKENLRHLVNTWQLESYYLNGADSTAGILVSDYTEEYSEDGQVTRSYLNADGEFITESGTWEYDEISDTLFVNELSSMNWIDNYSSVNNTFLIIQKLNRSELWYSFYKSEDLHELHFIEKK